MTEAFNFFRDIAAMRLIRESSDCVSQLIDWDKSDAKQANYTRASCKVEGNR